MVSAKSAEQLEREIAEYLAEKPRHTPRKLPHYDQRKGWCGGDRRTLYAFIDKRTGHVVVRPGGLLPRIGPEATVRIATRGEAERLWQSPLSSGWKVA
jgi:hypothetical protein